MRRELIPKNNFGKVTINDHDGDLSKRWYVHFTYRNPAPPHHMESFKRTEGVNRIKTKKERRRAIRNLKKAIEALLQEGWSPFEKFESGKAAKNSRPDNRTITQGIDHVVRLKTQELKASSSATFTARIKIFREFLESKEKGLVKVDQISRSDVSDFLQHVQEMRGLSNFSRNNYLVDVRTLFSKLEELEYTTTNPAKAIKKLPAEPVKNRAFTATQIKQARTWLLANDPYLYLFIRWVAYAFLRPVEVCRIRVKHLDLVDNILHIETKKKADKLRVIIPRLRQDLEEMQVHSYQPGDLLFTKHGHPGQWISHTTREEVPDMGRRTYFGNRFNLLKKAMGWGREYGIYSFRHTAAGDILANLRGQGLSLYEAKLKMMPITGHDTMEALEKYLREAQIDVPKDHSKFIGLKF